jgi:hypothetical protein
MLRKAAEQREVIVKQCHANFVEVAISVFTSDEKFLGLLYFHQIQPMGGSQKVSHYQKQIKKYANLFNLDVKTLRSLYISCPQYTQKELEVFMPKTGSNITSQSQAKGVQAKLKIHS